MNSSNDHTIKDLAIQRMLADRSTSLDKIDPENEEERRRRLTTLIKTSKKYRRLSVKLANDQWDSESDDSTKFERIPKVTFSDAVEVIPESKKVTESLAKIIQSIFKRGRL